MGSDFKGQTQDYGKINFDFVLMTFIGDINKQLSKLPHESIIPNMNDPVGTTHEDIINSYCDMVEHLEVLLEAYHDDTYILGATLKEADRFKKAKQMFGNMMKLCERKNFLFTKIRVKVSGEDSV